MVRPAYVAVSVSIESPGNMFSNQAPPFGVDMLTKNLGRVAADCARALRGSREGRKGIASSVPPSPRRKCLRPRLTTISSSIMTPSVEASLFEGRCPGQIEQHLAQRPALHEAIGERLDRAG